MKIAVETSTDKEVNISHEGNNTIVVLGEAHRITITTSRGKVILSPCSDGSVIVDQRYNNMTKKLRKVVNPIQAKVLGD